MIQDCARSTLPHRILTITIKQKKSQSLALGFFLNVGHTGFEPVTSTLSR